MFEVFSFYFAARKSINVTHSRNVFPLICVERTISLGVGYDEFAFGIVVMVSKSAQADGILCRW